MTFTVEHRDSKSSARAGVLTTDHGELKTPIFMPVGTLGTVKAVHQRELRDEVKARIILGNTYHLFLRPGIEILEKAGGLHRFMNWDRPILTDSGGYQVFSLSANRKITPEGVTFQSHIDGTRHLLTPENVIGVQRKIGADVIMAFDECAPYPCDRDYAARSMDLTHRWLERCCVRFDDTTCPYDYSQVLFPIVQGSIFGDLREQSAEFIARQNRDGNAIGGLSVGEPSDMMYEMTELVCGILPQNKPRYLMGVGTPENLLECIALGVDMFDCVIPSRNGRNGMLFTGEGIINMRNKKWEDDYSPVDSAGESFASREYSKAYLRHLFISNERLAAQIATIHNLSFYRWLMEESRKKIIAGVFASWKNMMIPKITARL